jgi:aryl-alcohol dehydrogenase-like predicted oxidoreductase
MVENINLPELTKTPFGDTGLCVSRLAFGTGTHGMGGHSDQSALGVEGLADLLIEAYEHGVNFWDAADAYGTHSHLARALQIVPRHQVVILTKTTSRSGKRVSQDIKRFLRELGTEVIDIVLLHAMTGRDWSGRYSDAMEALTRFKEQGQVRAVGISCHSLAALEAAAQSSWTDVLMARINQSGVQMDAALKKVAPVLRKMHAGGKAVIGMKVLGVGRLGSDPREALKFVFDLGSVDAVTVGMRSRKELLANVRAVGGLTG